MEEGEGGSRKWMEGWCHLWESWRTPQSQRWRHPEGNRERGWRGGRVVPLITTQRSCDQLWQLTVQCSLYFMINIQFTCWSSISWSHFITTILKIGRILQFLPTSHTRSWCALLIIPQKCPNIPKYGPGQDVLYLLYAQIRAYNCPNNFPKFMENKKLWNYPIHMLFKLEVISTRTSYCRKFWKCWFLTCFNTNWTNKNTSSGPFRNAIRKVITGVVWYLSTLISILFIKLFI